MFLDNLEQDYNNHIYLKRAISKILPLLIKNNGIIDIISSFKAILIIPYLSNVTNLENYIIKCPHITYMQDNNTKSIIIEII